MCDYIKNKTNKHVHFQTDPIVHENKQTQLRQPHKYRITSSGMFKPILIFKQINYTGRAEYYA